ncbi:uncharacterized protein METZ01_LOCUS57653 [marine metagenome]|uniref:Uncharacterized protein n=1 Tax=marine metagenome TaxID=408172 RepID=A0A381SMX0_9ZZZZ
MLLDPEILTEELISAINNKTQKQL